MKRGKSTDKPTNEEQARLDKLGVMQCICCTLLERWQPNRTTIHHIVDKGYRSHSGGHMATIPLCEYHHQGYPKEGYQACDMEAKWGPSLELAKKRFIAKFGTERELLAKVNKMLGVIK